MDTVVMFHGNCIDGAFGAAITRQGLRARSIEPVMVPCVHGDPVPDLTGTHLFLVDYAPDPADVWDRNPARVTILDHHATTVRQWTDQPIDGVITTTKSGCEIVFEYFNHPSKTAPPVLAHISDRDRSVYALANTADVFAAIASYSYAKLDLVDWLLTRNINDLVTEGAGIERYRQQLINAAVANAGTVTIGGHQVLAANAPIFYGVDVARALATDAPFGAYWNTTMTDTGTLTRWGLQSHDTGIDVSIIAEAFGGGGHARSAGYRTKTPA
jgi:uncharacterized protein